MFTFLHAYHPDLWQAQVDQGLVNDGDGIRFCQSKLIADEMKFNRLAAKGGALYNLLSERKCPFYVDRLQGGCYIDDYVYDAQLLEVYRELLGENFWGFQMHEWLSNYRSDLAKIGDLPAGSWNKAEIESVIYEKFPFPCLFLECMTAEEMAEAGKPETLAEFYRNMTAIYKKRMAEVGDLIPCDSAFLAYPFELAVGTKRIAPEVGAQTADARVQVCYARGMAKAYGRSFGVYYEPWGGSPFSACCYQTEGKNEWGIGESADFPFETAGPNGGSSRSLQMRIFLYAYFSNAEFLSEEWGLCNVFTEWETCTLSTYGEAKRDFQRFVQKYPDVGEKLTPIAAVLPKDLMVLEEIYSPNTFCGYAVESSVLPVAKDGVRRLFADSAPMTGTEQRTLINSKIPDALDLVNGGISDLSSYAALVDLTGDPAFAAEHPNCIGIDAVESQLKELLPCFVRGNVHWMVNHRIGGGYYLTIFNHSGVVRSVADGEYTLPEADESVAVTFRNFATPTLCEGDVAITTDGKTYRFTVPAGSWCLLRF
ncbi:MAG: hypothetical protein IKU55_00920 [Clostridia bacterium]|nr:hypothetical protein [Clostridia bacterium]